MVAGNCSAGYYCTSGAESSTPSSEEFAGPCPAGYYCPEATVNPIPCEPGTYYNETLNTDPNCLPCPAGWYCDLPGT